MRRTTVGTDRECDAADVVGVGMETPNIDPPAGRLLAIARDAAALANWCTMLDERRYRDGAALEQIRCALIGVEYNGGGLPPTANAADIADHVCALIHRAKELGELSTEWRDGAP